MHCREVLIELTAPERFASLMAQEQQHWQQHLAPVLARYKQNEARLQQLMAAQAQQQQQQHVLLQEVLLASTQELGSGASNTSSGSSRSSRSSDLVMDLVPAAARIQSTAEGTGGDRVYAAPTL
jgi:hypothetical protein